MRVPIPGSVTTHTGDYISSVVKHKYSIDDLHTRHDTTQGRKAYVAGFASNNTQLAVGQGLWAGLAYTLDTGVMHFKDSVGLQILHCIKKSPFPIESQLDNDVKLYNPSILYQFHG